MDTTITASTLSCEESLQKPIADLQARADFFIPDDLTWYTRQSFEPPPPPRPPQLFPDLTSVHCPHLTFMNVIFALVARMKQGGWGRDGCNHWAKLAGQIYGEESKRLETRDMRRSRDHLLAS